MEKYKHLCYYGEVADIKNIYFNNAAAAYPLAPGVIESMTQALQKYPQVSGRDVSASSDSLQQCRKRLACLLGVDAPQIVLIPGATHGLNMALLGIGLKQGDVVLTNVMEHNSVLRPLAHLEDKYGIKVRHIPLDAAAKLDKNTYDRLLAEKPRLVALTHASNVTGRINPVRQWFEDAKSVGAITLLDAGQTAGRVSILPKDLRADIVVFPGYKGLRGPVGTGALYVSPQITLEPIFTGGTGIKGDLRLQPEEMPMRLESGTPNTPAFAGLNIALRYYKERASEIAKKEREITERMLSGLLAIPNVRVFDEEPGDRLPVISFSVKGMDAETAGFALSKSFGIECRAGLHCAPLMHKALGVAGTVRLSPSYVNSMEDIYYAIEAVRMVAT
jgi:selenocysteine lyase/cysteine desulfurase